MPRETPYFIKGWISEIFLDGLLAVVSVENGSIYHLTPFTPGIEFSELAIGVKVECEITSKLIRVLSAKILKSDK